MYFLAQGQCEVIVKDHTKKDVFVQDLKSGSFFGEVALLFKCKRTTSVKSKDQCTLGALSEDSFTELCLDYPHIEQLLKHNTTHYVNTWKSFQLALLS